MHINKIKTKGVIMKKTIKQRTDELTKKAVIKRITNIKDLKYAYPEDCDSLKKRKRFRHKVRARIKTLNKELLAILNTPKHKGIRKAHRILEKYEAEVLIAA